MTSSRPLVGTALLAAAVFVVEIALLRAVAITTWPPFAFLALSAAMLGGGVAGTALAVRPAWAAAARAPWIAALVVALGAPAAVAAALFSGVEPLRVQGDLVEAARFAVVLGALAVPFAGLSLCVSSLLVVEHHRPHAVYGADLLGAALGAFAAPVFLDAGGVVGAGAIAGCMGAVGALAFAASHVQRAAGAASLVVAAAAASLLAAAPPFATVDKQVGGQPARDALARLARAGKLATFDGVDGRVDVIPAQPAPVFLMDEGSAVTRAPIWPSSAPPPRDAASAAFLARPPVGGAVLVLGAGAGYEVARALAYGAARVDAVEVSRTVVAAARSGAAPAATAVYADPRVTLHLDEARAFLERAAQRGDGAQRWRAIVAVHTISNAAVTAGALRLAEDFLLTEQSLTTLVGALEDDGVLYLTRPASQIAALADLARAALVAHGVAAADVDEHLALVAPVVDDPFFRGLLVFRSRILDRGVIAAPVGTVIAAPPPPTGKPLATDARPFFHRGADDVTRDQDARQRIEGPAIAAAAITTTAIIAAAIAAIAIVAPLAARRVRRPRRGRLVVAALLGVAFITVELALTQRLTLVCGRPTVAFAAVVGGMLLGAGGAALAPWKKPSLTAALTLSAIAAAIAAVAPPLVTGALVLGPVTRAITVGLVAALVGLPLGLPFPALVDAARVEAPQSAPWLFAVSATTSVLAAALYSAVAPATGLVGAAAIGALAYGLAAVVARADSGPPQG